MNQEIKELLELAAKACGKWIAYGWTGPEDQEEWGFIEVDTNCFWHPHEDDGDGARMETQLDLDIQRHKDRVVVCSQDIWRTVEFYADHNGNRQAARRMASLRVAAEVGRRMK